MWIALNDSFLSIVANTNDTETLLVRARRKGDIEAVFPKADVIVGGGTDYGFRAFIPRLAVANAIADRVERINYGNFKASVKNRTLHDVYLGMWVLLRKMQESLK
jgi:hypothetical protein